MRHRLRVSETDQGEVYHKRIEDLYELVRAYKNGDVKEHQIDENVQIATSYTALI